MSTIIKTLAILTIMSTLALPLHGQMKRERVKTNEPAELFSTPALLALSTTEQLPARNLNVTIMHSFGIATRGVVRNFFGLDNVQNVRLGLDYGLTDRWSVGIGRSSLLNVVDFRTKYSILQQKPAGSTPLNLSIKGDLGIVTSENNRPFEDDISSTLSAILSGKVTDDVSFQLAPMYSYFSLARQGQENHLISLGMGSEIQLSQRYSLIAEYLPVLGNRNTGTKNAFTLGFNIETGGHVFQLYFTSTEWHLEQYVLATNNDQFWAGDFRFGFNVNRIFGL